MVRIIAIPPVMLQVFLNHHRASTSWFHMRMAAFSWQVGVALILYTYMAEVLCSSNLSWDTSYPDWGFSWLFWITPGKCQDSLWVGHDPVPSKSFPSHLSSCHSELYIVKLLTVLKNKPTKNHSVLCSLCSAHILYSTSFHGMVI
jgi:hypothetical protein